MNAVRFLFEEVASVFFCYGKIQMWVNHFFVRCVFFAIHAVGRLEGQLTSKPMLTVIMCQSN